jgi:diguanylate cyclase (GGDEF)-like protein
MNAHTQTSTRQSLISKRPLFSILLIDDDPVFQTLISSYLEGTGYNVTVCDSVENGILLLADETFKLVLCDWQLPGMSGIDLCRHLRQDEIDYHYFIFVTSKTSDDEMVYGFNAGADDYIRKGVRKLELIARLDAGLRILLQQDQMQRQQQEIERQSKTDALTDCYNRRYLMETGNKEIIRSHRYNQPLSLIMCDIDHFKSVNDQYGHLAGDEVLKLVAQTFRQFLRYDLDSVCRFGGEEFAVLLPNTPILRAKDVAEKLRLTVAKLSVNWAGCELNVTCSFGVSCSDSEKSETFDDLIAQADLCLYQSKHDGRNCVTS